MKAKRFIKKTIPASLKPLKPLMQFIGWHMPFSDFWLWTVFGLAHDDLDLADV
jgi:hypothetical protein